jgi:hypothetical protein
VKDQHLLNVNILERDKMEVLRLVRLSVNVVLLCQSRLVFQGVFSMKWLLL